MENNDNVLPVKIASLFGFWSIKNPKHLKCSLTRAKDESHKRVDSSSLFLSLSLCVCLSLSLSLSLSLCPPPVDHDIGVEPLI